MARNENKDQNRGQNPNRENNPQNQSNPQNPQGQKGQQNPQDKTKTPTGQQTRESEQLGQQEGRTKGKGEGDTFEREQTKGQANDAKEGSVGQGPSQSGQKQTPGEQNTDADNAVRGRTGTTPTEKSGQNRDDSNMD